MKYVIAIIKPHKLEDVMRELDKEEIYLRTVTEVLGCGRQKGLTEVYRGTKESGNLLKKIKLEIAVNENFVEPTIKAIIKGAKTGETGDGKIFVLNPSKYEVSIFQANRVEQVIRGESPLYKPLQRMGRGFISTAAHIVKSGDYVFVAFQNPDRKAQKKMDVFKGGQHVETLDVSGTPFVVDAQGRIYFAEEDVFPKIRRYTVER